MEGRTMVCYLAPIVGLLFMLLSGTSGLKCYQCAHTDTVDNPCEGEVRREANDTLDIPRHPHVKDCTRTNPHWDKCMILTVHYYNEGKNKLSLYQRECTDGSRLRYNTTRFSGLKPTNRSTCAYMDHKMVCYTFCDTDMCNGPLAPPVEPDPCANYTMRDQDDDGDYYYDYNVPPGCGAAGVHSHAAVVMVMLLLLLLSW